VRLKRGNGTTEVLQDHRGLSGGGGAQGAGNRLLLKREEYYTESTRYPGHSVSSCRVGGKDDRTPSNENRAPSILDAKRE